MSTISNAPTILKDFLSYHETVKAHSAKTVDEYFLDLRTFFRYLKRSRGLVSPDTPWDSISIADVDLELVGSVSLSEIYDYLIFLSRERQLNTASLARKIAAIRSFYRYLTSKAHLLEENPVQELDSPRMKKTLPRYLTLEEPTLFVRAKQGADYCILMLFLNCGLRKNRTCPTSRATPSECWAKATKAHPVPERRLQGRVGVLSDGACHAIFCNMNRRCSSPTGGHASPGLMSQNGKKYLLAAGGQQVPALRPRPR